MPFIKISKKNFLGLGLASFVGVLFLLLLIWGGYSLWHTQKTYQALKNREIKQATRHAQIAQPFAQTVSTITFHQLSTVEAWKLSLQLVPQFQTTITKLSATLPLIFLNTSENTIEAQNKLQNLQQNLTKLSEQIDQLSQKTNQSLLLKKRKFNSQLTQANQLTQDLLIIWQEIATGPHTVLVLLQNTEEIRATGGFMGSYARIELENGVVESIKIQDIYEPDGQFTGFIESPAGAKDFLSDGNGLRLPDANWHPDLAISSQDILSYFALGDEKSVDTIITLNVELIEKIVNIVGEVYLSDYGITVSSSNLTTLARADREQFFPGSKQKVNFLDALFDQLKIKLTQLDENQKLNILNLLPLSLQNKDLQFYSQNTQLQQTFTKHNIDGGINFPNQTGFYFYSIESNVGINKANKKVKRQTQIDLDNDTTKIQINWENQNSDLEYINYQRLILPTHTQIKNIRFKDTIIEEYDSQTIYNSQHQSFLQIGFLLPLAAQESGLLEIEIQLPYCQSNTDCKINIQKQSGIPPTPYTINYHKNNKNLVLERDESWEWN